MTLKLHKLDWVPEYHKSFAERHFVCDDPETKAYYVPDVGLVVVEWTIDEYGYEMLDWLGAYGSQGGEFVVDRMEGWLLGECEPEPSDLDEFLPEQYRGDATPYVPESEIPDDVWAAAEDARDHAWDEWNARHGYQILADVSRWRDSREYRYFKAGNDYANPVNWTSFDEAVMQKLYADALSRMRKFDIPSSMGILDRVPTREEAITALSALYVCEDYERMEDYNKGYWAMLDCWAHLYVNRERWQRDTYEVLGGIESDAEESYFAEVERQQIRELLKDEFEIVEEESDD